MREVGVDGQFAPFELRIPISSNCRRWLLDIELDLSNSLTTLGAVQWAICELQRMELQEHYSVPGSHLDQAEAGKEQKGDSGGAVSEKGPSTHEQGSKDLALGNRSGILSDLGKSHDEEPINDSTRTVPRQHKTETPVEVRSWTALSKSTGKRKSDEKDAGNEGGKSTNASESPSTKELVFEVDHAEAGKRMAKRIKARLAVPDCISLTNLVSHCLLVSLDQVPPVGVEVRLGETGAAAEASHGARRGSETSFPDKQGLVDHCVSDDWLWLHKWLVRTCLSDSFASLDWLVAFVTAACQSLVDPMLDYLALELERRESQGSVSLASRIRRAGVLDYAAHR